MIEIVAAILATIVVAVFIHWIHFIRSQPKDLPPGPLPLPLIGSCFMFAIREPKDVFKDLYKRYGGAVTLYSGCSEKGRMVLLMDYDLLVDTFNSKKYQDGVNGRPIDIDKIRGVREGFSWTQYDAYKERRNFTLRCFKELGLASFKLTPHAFDELDKLFLVLEKQAGIPLKPADFLSESVSSCILMTVLSRRLELDDPETATLYKGARAFFDGNAFQMLMLPYAKFFQLFFTDTLAEGERLMEKTMEKWLQAEMERRKPSFNKEVINDMVDAYMTIDQKGPLTQHHFSRMLVDLFIGAIDTTSTAISWTLFYLSHMPDEQERLFKHIEAVVPANSHITLEHKDKLPRVEALINEVHRYGNMTMIGLPRCSYTDEVSFSVKGNQYKIPRGGTVWFTNYISQHDDKYWGDPDNFRIDRWLSPEGDKLINHTHWFQFGIGRRSCTGEQVARNLFFLYVASLIQQFRWHQETDFKFDEYEMRITKIPPPMHKLVFTKRE